MALGNPGTNGNGFLNLSQHLSQGVVKCRKVSQRYKTFFAAPCDTPQHPSPVLKKGRRDVFFEPQFDDEARWKQDFSARIFHYAGIHSLQERPL